VHKDWTVVDFKRLIWSRECSVAKSKDSGQQEIFREPGEKWLPECIHSKEKDKRISLMVWWCFWGKKRGPLIPIIQNINKTRYVRLLRRYLFPVNNPMIFLGIQVEDIHFEEDNAPVYKAYSVIDWFGRNFIEVEKHSSYSADLNPIEHA